jgi:outer membrane murein-binding lipoprotein Lpp
VTSAELLGLLSEPATRETLQRLLGLPTESVAEALRELAAAGARTDARLDRLTETVDRLAERVDRLAETVGRLAERVDRLEAAVERLAEAQLRTEAAVERLARGQDELRRAVGTLSDNVGFGLEELAAIVLPGVLEREERLRVDHFIRRFMTTEVGEEEIDLFAEAERDGGVVPIVGEVKSRIYTGDVRKFFQKLQRIAAGLPSKPVGVMFGFVVHPAANDAARELGVHVVASRPAA